MQTGTTAGTCDRPLATRTGLHRYHALLSDTATRSFKAKKRIKVRLSSVAKGDVKQLTVPTSRETSFCWLPPFTQHLGATVDSTVDRV